MEALKYKSGYKQGKYIKDSTFRDCRSNIRFPKLDVFNTKNIKNKIENKPTSDYHKKYSF